MIRIYWAPSADPINTWEKNAYFWNLLRFKIVSYVATGDR